MITTTEQICMHAYVAYSYKEGKTSPDDILSPIVLVTLSMMDAEFFKPEDVHKQVVENFSKDFPYIIIQRELAKLTGSGIIERNLKEKTKLIYSLKKDLSEVKDSYRKSQDETNVFLIELQKFIENRRTQYGRLTLPQLMKRVEVFCSENIGSLVIFFGKKSQKIQPVNTKLIDQLICDFFEIKVKNNDALLSAFENVFNGILLSKIAEMCSENLVSTNYDLKKKTIYLDTNILLRILDLQSEYLNVLGHELYSLLVENNFELKVFNRTIEELNDLLRKYKQGAAYFIKGKDISHVYQVLKNQDIDVYEIDDYINELPNKLLALNINIDKETDFAPVDYGIFDNKINELAKLKFDRKNIDTIEFDVEDYSNQKYLHQAKHDLYCINQISCLRGDSTINRFEDTEYYFVTAESTLIRFNKQNYNFSHISETIGDYTLSFLLFFYKPNSMKGISLRSFIAANYSNKELSIANWIKYVEAVNKKYKDGKLSQAQFGYLLTRTILNNQKFIDEDLDSLVNGGVEEFNKIVTRNSELERTNFEIAERLNASISENAQINQKVNDLENKNGELQSDSEKKDEQIHKKEADNFKLKSKNQDQAKEISDLRKSLKIIRIFLFVLFIFIIAIGIGVIPINKVIGLVTSSIGAVLNIINIIDVFKKWLIKD